MPTAVSILGALYGVPGPANFALHLAMQTLRIVLRTRSGRKRVGGAHGRSASVLAPGPGVISVGH
jgi:hypothetical protein